MKILESIVSVSNDILWTYVLIILLIGLGMYFTIRSNFVQFRMIGEMFRLLGQGTKGSKEKKGITSFQAFSIGTAARVGTGNLAGVALAIATGGPGAVFWMWIIALIGAASSFVESTLAQIYKVKDEKGYRGGPAYYMEKGLNRRWMGILFAVLITLCFGFVFNSVQANTISLAFNNAYGIDRDWMGLILALLTAIVIFGGVKRIARVTEWMVPIMAGGYVLIALFIMLINITQVPGIFMTIFSSAFGINQAIGGGIGAALMMGIKRGLFSNEAGMGSGANAAATAEVSHPVKQGLVQALSVFTDTLIVCSATAFIILLAGNYGNPDLTGIELTQAALSTHMGSWATSFVAIIVFLFAFSSVIGNYYYGETNIAFIRTSKVWLFIYRFLVVGMVFYGSGAKIEIVWDMADLFMGLMALLNLIAIGLLGRIAFLALQDYRRQKKAGMEPVFHASSIEGLTNVECWGDEGK